MGDIELQIFSDRLKELRTSLGLTQAQFVDGLGITASALSAYEKNLKNPSISVARRIAQKYHISIDWLCGLSEKKNYDNEINTYNDLFRIFFEIEKACGVTLGLVYSLEVCDVNSANAYDLNSLAFSEYEAQQFISEWGKMKKLHDDNIIDDDVYNLWKEKVLNKTYDFTPRGCFIHSNSPEDNIMDDENF